MIYSDTRYVQTEIHRDLHKKLKIFCLDNDVTLTILISQIVTDWIKNNITLKEVTHGQEENDKKN